MRKFLVIAFVAVALLVPWFAGVGAAGESKSTRCNQHGCPLAQSASTDGFQAIAHLQIGAVSVAELEK